MVTVSKSLSVITITLKSRSNFSSSISCVDGTETMISPSSSNALNTKNDLAAFKIHASCTLTVSPNTLFPCETASLITFCSVFPSLISCHPAPSDVSGPSSSFAGASSFFSAFSSFAASPSEPFKIAFNALIKGSLSFVPSSAVS